MGEEWEPVTPAEGPKAEERAAKDLNEVAVRCRV